MESLVPPTAGYTSIMVNIADRWPYLCCVCAAEVDNVGFGCPTHAPREVPGLETTDCWAEPKHPPTWVVAFDGYGVPCPHCQLAPYQERDREEQRCRHWPWRRWAITRNAVHILHLAGVFATTGGMSFIGGSGCWGCQPAGPVRRLLRGRRYFLFGIPLRRRLRDDPWA